MGNWITALGIPEVIEGLLCCTTSAISAACSKCSVGHPRFVFSLFLLFGTVASFLVLTPNMRQVLGKVPYFCTAVTTEEMCDDLVGYGAVYRICFSLAVFYVVFALLMLSTTSTNDFRLKLHNGYWVLKLIFMVLILVVAFHIPRHSDFGRMWMYAGLTGGFMFIMIQIFLVIDFAHSWSISWAEKVDTGNTNLWYIALAVSTILIYSVAVTMAVLFYLFFTDLRNFSKCRGNMFLISFNFSHCILASFISVLPRVQEESTGSGLLQSSVVMLYTMYLTWCTLSSEPDASCNPLGNVILEYDMATGVNGQALFDCVLMFALLTFACNVRSGTSRLEKLGLSLSKLSAPQKYSHINTFEETTLNGRDKKRDDEFVEYNYSYFHFVMFLASLQLMMVITNWHGPDELANMKKLVKNWATVWIQLSASFLCVLFYVWAMVAPLLVTIWGPCLGLDYERVPMEDDYEYGRSRRRMNALCASEVYEETETRKNSKDLEKSGQSMHIRKNVLDKNRQSITDSGMFDLNATNSQSISQSRTSLRPSSQKSMHSETDKAKRSEDNRDNTFDSMSPPSEQMQINKKQRKESSERPQSRESAVLNDSFVRPQSRQTFVREESDQYTTQLKQKMLERQYQDKSQSPVSRSLSPLGDIKEQNDETVTLSATSPTRKKDSTREIKNSINSSCKEGKLLSRTPSRSAQNSQLSKTSTTLSNTARVSSRTSLKSCSSDVSFPSELADGTTTINKAPSERKNDHPGSCLRRDEVNCFESRSKLEETCQPKVPGEVEIVKLVSSVIKSDQKTLFSDQNKNSRPCSRAVHAQQSEISDGTDVAGSISTIYDRHRMSPSEERNRPSRPCSRTDVINRQKPSSLTETAHDYVSAGKKSVRKHLGTENKRTSSAKGGQLLLQMQDHLQWVRSQRKSKAFLPALQHSQTLEPWTDGPASHKTQVDAQNGRVPNKSLGTSERQPFQENMQTSFHVRSEALEIGGISDVEKPKPHKRQVKSICPQSIDARQGQKSSNNGLLAPDVSKEILRLQAKILKFQAKVVKTQQRILEMQEKDNNEGESPTKNPT